jgi:hypothetical protein
MADHMRTSLVLDALEMAIGRRQPESGLLHHSDRGSQYASRDYRSTLDRQGFQTSMSRKGSGSGLRRHPPGALPWPSWKIAQASLLEEVRKQALCDE